MSRIFNEDEALEDPGLVELIACWRKNTRSVRRLHHSHELAAEEIADDRECAERRLIELRLSQIDAETELAQAAADLERAVGMDLP